MFFGHTSGVAHDWTDYHDHRPWTQTHKDCSHNGTGPRNSMYYYEIMFVIFNMLR